MAASFTLELDTTGPQIEILAPLYTLPEIETEVIIQANEVLAPNAEIWVIDSLGERYDVTFSHEGDRFSGIIKFTEFPLGVAWIYALVRDEVHNLSNLVTKSINIRLSANIEMQVSSKVREIQESAEIKKVKLKGQTIDIVREQFSRCVDSRHITRRIEVTKG
jgi:hypothetical protein